MLSLVYVQVVYVLSLYWRGCPLQLVRTIQIPNFLEGNYDIYNANPCNSYE
jgi:hypothetical protein